MMPRTKTSLRAALLLAMLLTVGLTVAELAADGETPPPGGDQAAAGGAGGQTGADADKDKDKKETLLSLLFKGGWVMIPIGLCSVAAIALSVERFLSLRRNNIIPPTFLDGLKAVFGGQSSQAPEAIAYCQSHPCPMSEIVKSGMRRIDNGYEAVEKGVEDAGEREVYKMNRSLRPLQVIAMIAPLLGLLGTVYGLITAFQAASGGGSATRGSDLAKGIYEAMVTTAAGLTLAIPVVIVVQILTSRIDGLVDEMDEQAIEFLEYTGVPGAPRA